MGRGQPSQDLVRADQVAPVLPSDSRRPGTRQPAADPLRRSRFLKDRTPEALKAALVADARAEGFAVVRVTRPDAVPEAAPRLRQFLRDGYHGTMDWLEGEADRRGD